MSSVQTMHYANKHAKDYFGSLGVSYFTLIVNQTSKLYDIVKNQQSSALTKTSGSALTMLKFPSTISFTLNAIYQKDPLDKASFSLNAVRSSLGAASFVVQNYFKKAAKALPAMDFIAEVADTTAEGIELYQAVNEKDEAKGKLKSEKLTTTQIISQKQKKTSCTIAIVSKVLAVFVGLASIFAIVFNVAVLPASIACVLTIASLSLGMVRHFYDGINAQECAAKLKQQKAEKIS